MNGNAELLNFIYQNSQMGVQTIDQLVGITDDAEFLKVLTTQLQEYTLINNTAKELLNKNNYSEKDISAFEKLTTYVMINFKTLTDKSTTHIVEMMLQGSTMGIIDAKKNITKYSDAEPDILHLMKKLLKTEENNVETLKAFL